MLLYANLGRRAWYCGLGNAHPISRLRAAARSRFVLSPGSFRPMAKKREDYVALQECCGFPQDRRGVVCPKNNKACKPLPRITVEALIRPEHKHSLALLPYYFCDSPSCDVVYVSASGEQLITKNQLRVRVGIKENKDPIP